MQKDAEAHSADDEKRKELVEARNIADQAVYAAEKAIKEFGDPSSTSSGQGKPSPEVVKDVQDKIDALKTAQKGEDAGTIKSATEALSTTLSKIGEAMMKQTPPGGEAAGPDQSGGTPPESAGPTDAEFKEKE